MVYGLLRALPGDHACLTPSPALLLADLTPTIGASEPHDFAVRVSTFVTRTARVHRIPPHVDDVAQRPSEGRDRIAIVLICPRGQAEFLKFRNRPGVAPIPNLSIGDLNEIADRRHPEVPERSGGLEGRRRRDVPVTILRGAQASGAIAPQSAPQDDVALCGNVAYFRLFTASSKLALSEPGRSGCCWLSPSHVEGRADAGVRIGKALAIDVGHPQQGRRLDVIATSTQRLLSSFGRLAARRRTRRAFLS
jgi:hypothetical protein